jgi:hypothetical protein
LAEETAKRLGARGLPTTIARVAPAVRDEAKLTALLGKIAEADLVVLDFPVYWDSLPGPLVGLLEAWARGRTDGSMPASVRLAVITQCGFPEEKHCEVAVQVCQNFAENAGVAWAGALAFGMGASVEGAKLEKSPLAGRLKAFDAALDALASGGAIPASATATFAKPLAPAWLYPILGKWMWESQAKKKGCTEPLTLKRYAS